MGKTLMSVCYEYLKKQMDPLLNLYL